MTVVRFINETETHATRRLMYGVCKAGRAGAAVSGCTALSFSIWQHKTGRRLRCPFRRFPGGLASRRYLNPNLGNVRSWALQIATIESPTSAAAAPPAVGRESLRDSRLRRHPGRPLRSGRGALARAASNRAARGGGRASTISVRGGRPGPLERVRASRNSGRPSVRVAHPADSGRAEHTRASLGLGQAPGST